MRRVHMYFSTVKHGTVKCMLNYTSGRVNKYSREDVFDHG